MRRAPLCAVALRLGSALALGLTVGAVASPSCQPAFTTEIPGRALAVTLTDSKSNDLGTAEARVPITFTTPAVYTVDVQANDDPLQRR